MPPEDTASKGMEPEDTLSFSFQGQATLNMSEMSERTFHCFRNLPPELRINIWRFYFPPEPRDLLGDLISIRANNWNFIPATTQRDEYGWREPTPNPAIARVCRESRAILFETYTLCLDLQSSSLDPGRPHTSLCLYLNPKRDTLEFRDTERLVIVSIHEQ